MTKLTALFPHLCLWPAFFYQIYLSASMQNAFCSCICLVLSIVVLHAVLTKNNFARMPLSSTAVAMFVVTHTTAPIVFMSLESRPLTFNLEQPTQTFLHCAATSIILITAHGLYKRSALVLSIADRLAHNVWSRIGLFRAPAKVQMWLIGLIGFSAMTVAYVFVKDVAVGQSTVLKTGVAADVGPAVKLLEGLGIFAYAPFLLPVAMLYGAKKNRGMLQPLLLALYLIALIILATSRNIRGTFAAALMTLACGYMLLFLVGKWRPKASIVVFTGLAAVIFVPLASDLATAMVMVRNNRVEVRSAEMTRLTFSAFFDKSAIREFQRFSATDVSSWNESYLSNPFLSRFCNIKFPDAALSLSQRLGEEDRQQLRRFAHGRLLALLPSPLLVPFGLQDLKSDVQQGSFGDEMYYLVGNMAKWESVLGGFRTSHLFGTGMAYCGYWYFLLLFCLSIFVFVGVDSLTLIPQKRTRKGGGEEERGVVVSPVGLLNIFPIAMIFSCESWTDIVGFLVRTLPQTILLYGVLIFVTKVPVSVHKYMIGYKNA